MSKKIMMKVFTLAVLLMTVFFANAQQGEQLPVVATPEEKLLNNQLEKLAKSERPVSKTPWLLSRTQTTSPQGLAPTNILVNNNNGAIATGNFTQSETTILAYGNNVITGFNDAGSNAGGTNRFTGYSYSTDGGLTFTDGGNLPASTDGDAGDPVLARNNTTGRIYFSTLGFSGARTIQLFRSDDNGLTWLPPVNATPGGSTEDKQWMAVDNYAGAGNGNLYLMSRRFSGTVGIYFHRSTDHGSTFSAGIQLFTGGQGAFVEVDPAHNIYAFYINGSGQILMRKSTDQGLTFAAAVTVATGLGTSNGDLALTGLRQGTVSYASFRSNSFPHVAINPVSGHIYVTYNNNPAGVDKGDVFMTMSTDGGATWSAPVRVNDDLTTTDQWQPTIAVSPDGLNLGIFYYSRQEDPFNNNLFKYYCRTAAISGATVTFRPSGPVSDVAAVPEFGRDAVINSTYMGDYQQAAATATGFYVSWADSRSDLAIGPPRKDPNVYFAKVPHDGVAGTSVLTNTTAPVISGGNGNATIDANECNSISISLTNVGVSPAQSINAVITSSTPGVVITQGSSAYPDIAPAASASNTTLFKIATSTGYVCGTNVQLTLTVTSSDGTVVFNFVLPATSSFGPPVSFSNNTATPILDVATTNIPIAVSGITTAIGKVTISLHLLHTWDSDLDISLIGPDGTTIDLSSDNGSSGDNFGTSCDPVTNRTTFDDAAATSITAGTVPFVGTFIPEQSLSLFNGKSGLDVNGTWTLRIVDDASGDAGTFNCVTLNIAANLPCENDGAPITCPTNITNAVNPVTYTVSTNSSGPVTLSYVFSGATTGSGSGTGSGSTFNAGITTVTVTSSNGCLASSCSFTVEVICVPPLITCPSNISVGNTTGLCGANVTYPAATSTGTSPFITYSQASGSFFPIGTTTVTATATNHCGTSTCTFTITVNDTENPVINCPSSITVNADPGQCYATNVVLDPSAPVTVVNPDFEILYKAGSTTVTAPLFPNTGGTISTTHLNMPGTTVTFSDGSVGNLFDLAGWTFNTQMGLTNFNSQFNVGSQRNMITWMNGASFGGGTAEKTMTQTLTANLEQNVSYTLKADFGWRNDNGIASVPPVLRLYAGATLLTPVTSADPALVKGAFVTYSRTYVVNNISISGPLRIEFGLGANVNGQQLNTDHVTLTKNMLGASDNCPGVTSTATLNGNPVTAATQFAVGNNTVVWTATDAAGNTATCNQTVTVTDNQPPTITCPGPITVCGPGAVPAANIASVTNVTDNCTGPVTVTHQGDVVNGYSVTVPYTITRTYRATDAATNFTECTQTITVNPIPYFACPANMVETITDVICFKAVVTPNPTICGTLTKLTWKLTGATLLSSPTSGINYLGVRNMKVGTTTVTYTATFTGGIVRTCSFTVLVKETVPPTILCPLDIHVNTSPGVCYRNGPVSLGTPTVGDNCGVASVTNNAPAVYANGVNFVTWTVTDKSGNTRTCVQRVTVNDVEKPVITCPANVIANTGAVCTATPVTIPHPVFSDNCGVVKLTWTMVGVTWGNSPNTGINYVPTMNFATGLSTITYTAVDAKGNQKACTFTVTVKDVTPPTLVCPAAQTFCKVANNTYSVPVMVQSDNCVIASTSFRITGATSRTGSGTNASGIFNLGVSTITWTVKDVNGNISTCTTTVTVVATTDPICSPPPFTGTEKVITPAITIIPKYPGKELPGLSITAWPNPTSSYFNLKVNSPVKETVLIRMYDMTGKMVQVKRGAAGDTYILGEGVVTGMYIIEVSQGDKKERVKLVKQ